MGPNPGDIARRFRKELPLRPDQLYLNMGTLAPTPRRTRLAMARAARAWMQSGPGGPLDPAVPGAAGGDSYLRMLGSVDHARSALAAFLGTEPASVALLGNATDALHAALLSIPFRPGDRIVTTDEEHDALAVALRLLARRFGLEIVTVPFPARVNPRDQGGRQGKGQGGLPDPDAVFDGQRGRKDRPVRLLALSHVSHRTGEVADLGPWLLAASARGIWTLVDGAHAVGTLEDPLGPPPGADFYAFPCHKWLFGPVGTGALRVGERALAETEPMTAGAPARRADGTLHPDPNGAWRYESGTRDWTRPVGLRASLDLLQECGGAVALSRHYRRLTESFAAPLGGRIAWRGEGPVLLLAGPDPEAWALALWERDRILTKPMEQGLRVSLGPWLTEEEVVHAAERIRERMPVERRTGGNP